MPHVTRLGDMCIGHGCFPSRSSISSSSNVLANSIPSMKVDDVYALYGFSSCVSHPGDLAVSLSSIFLNLLLPQRKKSELVNSDRKMTTKKKQLVQKNVHAQLSL